MTITTIGLLRHGQTDWNIDFRLQGTSDIPLNETGIEQSRTASAALSEDWDALVSSPLGRAVKTAEIVSERHSFGELMIEPLLLERSFGEAEGLRYEDWREKYPNSVVPGGESIADLEARCHRLLEKLVKDFAGRRVLTVSHGALIRKLLNIVSAGEFPREGERLGNASLSIISFDGTRWSIEDYRPQTLT
jgi:broad specificity phosphatase PhoE